ncbi:response regulator [Flavobacterium sp. 3HN19-14]|uniref:response regulator n=1 Tax=Flavobacterium sp. 3HN19-14 TaxID=3448133 RepID=UPI003EDEB5DD
MSTDLTVFYVDDDADDLDFFTGVTNDISTNINVVTHDHGEKLIDALHNPPPSPHIIFLDLNMPGVNGFDVLKEVRQKQELKDVPVVIFSTAKDEESVKKKLGAWREFLPSEIKFIRRIQEIAAICL